MRYGIHLPHAGEQATPSLLRRFAVKAEELGLDPAQFAIAYVTSRPFVTSNIIGATTLAQLEADMGSIEVKITPEIEARVDALHQLHGNPTP